MMAAAATLVGGQMATSITALHSAHVPPFLICVHDATPLYASHTRRMIQDLAPLVGRRLAFGVVPDWNGEWPLAAHGDFCLMLREASEQLLLHGYYHRRQHGWGPVTLLTGGADEMNGLDAADTRLTIERGQAELTRVFGAPARGFLAPAWQRGHVHQGHARGLGLDHVVGFFSLESWNGSLIPLATWTWDCGRWAWLGHVGHGIGALLQRTGRGVPCLAIHPRDLDRGFWPTILQVARSLLASGYEPTTPAALLRPG